MTNYYTVDLPDGPSDVLERAFAEVEGRAAPIMARLVVADGMQFRLSADDRAALSTYLALLNTRVPANRLASEQMAETLAGMQLYFTLKHPAGWRNWRRSHGDTRPDREIEAERIKMLGDLTSGRITIAAPEAMSLPTVLTGMEAIAPHIFDMGWWLVKRNSYPSFVLGDNPVTVWPGLDHPDGRGVGFASKGADVAVPLDPSTMLVMNGDLPDGYIVSEEWLERRLPLAQVPWSYHYRQWARAQRFVFARAPADLQAIEFMLPPEDRRRALVGLDLRGHPWAKALSRSPTAPPKAASHEDAM